MKMLVYDYSSNDNKTLLNENLIKHRLLQEKPVLPKSGRFFKDDLQQSSICLI